MTKEEQIKAWFEKYSTKYLGFNEYREFAKEYSLCRKNIDRLLLHLVLLTQDVKNGIVDTDFLMVQLGFCDFYLDKENFISELETILIKKNMDYGNSFDKSIDEFGWVYLAIELDKKKNRLKNLLRNKQAPNYESLEDTLLDIAGYCILALIYLENKGV